MLMLLLGSVVNLLKGTHYVKSSIVFTQIDGGIPGAPVTWQAYPPGADVTISGGASLDCNWQPAALSSGVVGGFECALPEDFNTDFKELFIDGLRQVKAEQL